MSRSCSSPRDRLEDRAIPLSAAAAGRYSGSAIHLPTRRDEMKSLTLVAATLGLLVATAWGDAAPKLPKDEKDDLKKLQGDWTFTAWETGGRMLAMEALETAKWTVKGDKYTFEMGGIEEEGTIKFDPSK